MSSRAAILERIRKASGRGGSEPTEAELQLVRAHIAQRTRGPQPSITRDADPVEQFKRECDRVGTTHSHAERLEGLPREVARYLEANDLERRIVGWHELAALDWAAAGITFEDRLAVGEDRTGITGCFCAVAETGTLLLLSSPSHPKKTALLPETHIAVVSAARMVRTMEDAFALLRAERGELPRATWFVSGASRTADIEMTLVVGAHGPYRAHVILVP
jgi:L-lactate dehydrogenase complex protein LldG